MKQIHKFTQEIKDKWLKALKSGKYIQCTGDLIKMRCGKPLHCCIGVLGEITEFLDNAVAEWDDDEIEAENPYKFLKDNFDQKNSKRTLDNK